MTGPNDPDGRGERGTGDPYRSEWLQGNVRPPFCSRGNRPNITGRNVGCRYCWPETCLWDDWRIAHGQSIDSPAIGITTTGRHRMPHRVGGLRMLLRLHRRAQEPTEEEERGG